MASSQRALNKGMDLYLLTRGNSMNAPEGATLIKADINDSEKVKKLLANHYFDVVVNWVAFKPEDINRDFELFRDKTDA